MQTDTKRRFDLGRKAVGLCFLLHNQSCGAWRTKGHAHHSNDAESLYDCTFAEISSGKDTHTYADCICKLQRRDL
jgi:hypothetical protein